MPKLTLAGHPVHPMLVAAPLGLLPFSLVMDCMYQATGKIAFDDCAYYTLVGGWVGGLAAGATGGAEYFTIEGGGKMKKTANTHAILNISAMVFFTASLMLRQKRRGSLRALLCSAIGTAGSAVAMWYGQSLVYDQGMRVKPVGEPEGLPEYKLPGDKKIVSGFEGLEERIAPEEPVES